MQRVINLYSDTQTTPSRAMRQAMADAEVGDEQLGEDPNVNILCERVADMLGFEAAMFAPSGTMCNQIAVLTHCRPGDEVICEESSHLVNTEGGGAAALAGVTTRVIKGENGCFTANQARLAIRTDTRTGPRSRLMTLEQTANFHGGRCWPLATISDVVNVVSERGLASHLDGARLFNAAIACAISPRAYAGDAGFDSAFISLTKGLGCPIGAVLCGSRAFIDDAWRWKYRLGGAMRQAGILAAAGLYALDHHIDRLSDDHRRARMFAEAMNALSPGLADPQQVETNIVILDTSHLALSAHDFARACAHRGIRLSVIGATRLRSITHLDIDDSDIAHAVTVIAELLAAGIAPADPSITSASHLY